MRATGESPLWGVSLFDIISLPRPTSEVVRAHPRLDRGEPETETSGVDTSGVRRVVRIFDRESGYSFPPSRKVFEGQGNFFQKVPLRSPRRRLGRKSPRKKTASQRTPPYRSSLYPHYITHYIKKTPRRAGACDRAVSNGAIPTGRKRAKNC